MAAYYGDIDRYSRLRRSVEIETEMNCMIRGIYHNTAFTKWCCLLPDSDPVAKYLLVQRAIAARFIMNNDISRVCERSQNLPYVVWYPTLASENTYRELARRCPKIKTAVLRASIFGNYQSLFDDLVNEMSPDCGLMEEARTSFNPHYRGVPEERVSGLGIDLLETIESHESWKIQPTRNVGDRIYPWLPSIPDATDIAWREHSLLCDGSGADASAVELYMSWPKELRTTKRYGECIDYKGWQPQKESEEVVEGPSSTRSD